MPMFDKREQNQGPNQPTPPAPPTPRPRLDVPETSRPVVSPVSNSSTIGESIIVKGDVSGSEDISVSGTVEGSISLPSNHVIVNSSGRVAANIKAKTIEVSGIVEGDLAGGDVVKINASGKMKGNIIAPRIVLQDGAKFKGMIDMEVSGGQGQQQKTPAVSKPAQKPAIPVAGGKEAAAEKSKTSD